MEQRRPQLLELLNALYESKSQIPNPKSQAAKRAQVALVGAGPGDPELWTQRAVVYLKEADLVLYDALVDAAALRRFTDGQCFCVGKRAHRESVRQDTIHRLMIRAARAGKRVVRLKGGDPFVFGRGGEEALALQHAGVPFDVVPGVTSAIAAPASVGIPLTHRGLASAFFVVSGHDRDVFAEAIGALRPNGVTIVVLMGFGRRAEIAGELLAAGWDRALPAAIVADGTLPRRQVWRGTLSDLADRRAHVAGDGPALIVIGKVAALDVAGADGVNEALSAPTGVAVRARRTR
jgi:uroporphyrin-III C-methyltransferase/precorrin-2 dehydrogenase/sirohydrochlorin ferrochelatase